MLQLLRPRQWTKNLLVFAALVFAEKLLEPPAVVTACWAFVAFCLASSAVYVVNDLVDAERDRLHPEKRHRPIAAGRVGRGQAVALALLLTLASLGLASWIGRSFGVATLIYLALSHLYSFAGKNVVVVDILMVALGFVLRAVAGALAIEVPYSDWFVLCTLFAALFIAVCKRRGELRAQGEGSATRPVLAQYSEAALAAFASTAMAAAIISYSVYVTNVVDRSAGELRPLLFTIPFVILAVFRYQLLVEKGEAGEKPEETLLTDRPLQISILGFIAMALLAFYGT